MKTIIPYLFFLSLVSCSKTSTPNPLVGTWKFLNETIANCTNSNYNGSSTCTTPPCPTLSINSNNTFVFSNGFGNVSGTYTITGNTITLVQAGQGSINGTLSGGVLSFVQNNQQAVTNVYCTYTDTFSK
ncbi:MAG: hypothetical protein JSS93_06645 [Bacteroidetes bacterium]|nr:hypothetical protein [Bacteroidota bacterium]